MLMHRDSFSYRMLLAQNQRPTFTEPDLQIAHARYQIGFFYILNAPMSGAGARSAEASAPLAG